MKPLPKPNSGNGEHPYEGKRLLIKVSGSQLEDAAFEHLVANLKRLIKNKVMFTLVPGGGDVINEKWRQAKGDEPRPRNEEYNVNVTTPEVLDVAVKPAYLEIRKRLEAAIPKLKFVEQTGLQCEYLDREKFDLVGKPVAIDGAFDSDYTAVGFVGTVFDKEGAAPPQEVNVNGADIARLLVEQNRHEIDEVLFVTKEQSVKDKAGGKRIPLILSSSLNTDGSHIDSEKVIEGGMQKNTKEILEMLPFVGKVALTDAMGIGPELENEFGEGTMFIYRDAINHFKAKPKERKLYEAICDKFEKDGVFRGRASDERGLSFDNHHFLKCKDSVLGGFSMEDRGNSWSELSTVWSWPIGNGIGEILMEHTKQKARAEGVKNLFALTTNPAAQAMFEKAGFVPKNEISKTKDDLPADAPETLRNYTSTPEHDPQLYVLAV